MPGQVQATVRAVRGDRQHADRGEQPVVLTLILERLLYGGQDLAHGAPGEHHGPPGDPEADSERRLVRPAAADIADHGVHPAVRRLDHVVEVAAEQHLLTAGPVTGGYRQSRVRQQRRRQQAAFEPGVLRRVQPGLAELALGLFGAAAFDRVTHYSLQQEPVYLALDQVVLCARGDGFLTEVLVGDTGENHHGQLGPCLLQPPDALQAARVGELQVE